MYRVLLCFTVALLPAAVLPTFAVSLPNETQQTTFMATVMEQATLSVPDQIVFDVTDITSDTVATSAPISATAVALTEGNALRIELIADAATFSPPAGATITWSASDVSWNAPAWTGGTGLAGTLSSAAYTKVAESNVNASELSTAGIDWTLTAKSTIDHAGDYILTGTWKFSSFTP